jgi:hypothetical protein
MEDKIVYTALENLKKHTGIAGFFTANHKKGLDGEVNMALPNGKEVFLVVVKREIRNHQLGQIMDFAAGNKNFLLIAETIFPKIKAELHKQGIAYLDIAGNIFLQTAKHHLWIEGHKKEIKTRKRVNRAFTATGLKVVYLFLIDEDLLNRPQRTIAEEAGIALGNINYIMNGLKDQQFLIQKGGNAWQLINKNELYQKWIAGFEEKLKPTLHIGNFRFGRKEDEREWKGIKLKHRRTFWGAEPAGGIITKYLKPEIYTLYTEETRNDLIKNYRLVPDIDGNIKVYKKFWGNHATFNDTVVHPVLAYADLLNTGNSRNIETAKMIYDKHIKANL